jgi:hypothetical protein
VACARRSGCVLHASPHQEAVIDTCRAISSLDAG